MKRILVALATLVAFIGCTKYKPYENSPQEHLLMGGHLPLNVQDHLRPMYPTCTPAELVDLEKIDAIEQRQFKCSAVVLQNEDWVHLVNWEAPADITGQPQGALAAGLVVLRAARKYKIAAGTLDPSGRDTATWQTNAFQFCEVHPVDADGMNWEKGKCWNTPTSHGKYQYHSYDDAGTTGLSVEMTQYTADNLQPSLRPCTRKDVEEHNWRSGFRSMDCSLITVTNGQYELIHWKIPTEGFNKNLHIAHKYDAASAKFLQQIAERNHALIGGLFGDVTKPYWCNLKFSYRSNNDWDANTVDCPGSYQFGVDANGWYFIDIDKDLQSADGGTACPAEDRATDGSCPAEVKH